MQSIDYNYACLYDYITSSQLAFTITGHYSLEIVEDSKWVGQAQVGFPPPVVLRENARKCCVEIKAFCIGCQRSKIKLHVQLTGE